MNKKILKKALCLILVMSCITTWAQESNKEMFYRNDLLGKKWVMYKNGNKKDPYFTFVFDNDSVTTTFFLNNKTKIVRYAYYLSDEFPLSFEDLLVGNSMAGCWLILNRNDVVSGIKQRDGGEMRIFTLNEHELSIGRSSEHQMILTAEPLDQ